MKVHAITPADLAGRDFLPTINAFWVGKELGGLHAACLKSFARHGHKVNLYVYEPPIDTPDGIDLADASRVMKKTEIVKHKRTGSLSFAADLFRYRLLSQGLGIYVDCDVFCLKPLTAREYHIGWQDDVLICNAVLAAPADSDLVKFLAAASADPAFIPPWAKPWKQKVLHVRKMVGVPKTVASMRWGTMGPWLLTHAVKKLHLETEAQPIDVFYPLAPKHRPLLLRPGLRIADLATPNTELIHLWNSGFRYQSAPAGSPLAEILAL
jgi:hypothetical protein